MNILKEEILLLADTFGSMGVEPYYRYPELEDEFIDSLGKKNNHVYPEVLKVMIKFKEKYLPEGTKGYSAKRKALLKVESEAKALSENLTKKYKNAINPQGMYDQLIKIWMWPTVSEWNDYHKRNKNKQV